MRLLPGTVVWMDFGRGVGREQAGHRPAVVVSSLPHLAAVRPLTTVIPVTTTDRGWESHVELTGDTGLKHLSYGVTEQVRTVSRQRVHAIAGEVDATCLDELALRIGDWLVSTQTAS